MQAMVHGYERRGILQAQKVFEGFKDLGSTSTIPQITYNHVNLKDQNFLT